MEGWRAAAVLLIGNSVYPYSPFSKDRGAGLPPLECLVGDLCPSMCGLAGSGKGEDWLVCYSFAIYL